MKYEKLIETMSIILENDDIEKKGLTLVYTLDEMIKLFLPNVEYDKNNEVHKDKLSNILTAFLGRKFDIIIENELFYLKLK